MVSTCLKIKTIRCSIYLDNCCPKFKVSFFCLLFSDNVLFFDSTIITKFWFENSLAPKQLHQIVESDLLCSENKRKLCCIFTSFITFDCKVSLCLSCIVVDTIGFFESSINSKSCLNYYFAPEYL